MQKTIKRAATLAAGAMVVASIAAPTMVSAWGDNSGGRRSYTVNQINAGIIDDKIVFNSISDGVDGDEKNFVDAQASTDDPKGTWQGNNITVKNGETYTIRLYVHNNNRFGRDMTAEDVKVFFSIPQTSAKQVKVNGFITSSNASPSKYWDYINFNSDNNAFHLEYVYGSAMLYNNGIGKGGLALNDDVVTKAGGALIGYDALDGKIPGCFDYDSYVTIQVKAVYDTEYTIEKSVRVIGGEKVWSNYVNANIGDTVEFQIEYNNTSTKGETQNNVMIKDIMPAGLEYVAGSTKLWNVEYNGAILKPDGSIFTDAINIGGYTAGSNAYVRFRAKVVEDGLACGDNTLVNWAQGGVGNVTIQDYASVIVNNNRCTPTPTPDPVEYKLTITYIYEDGTKAADTFTEVFQAGDTFSVTSPVIEGYTADHEVIAGRFANADLSYQVVYSPVPDEPNTPDVPDVPDVPEDPEEPDVRPDGPKADEPITKLPSTGPAEVASAILASGSVATAAGYYVASRRALKK